MGNAVEVPPPLSQRSLTIWKTPLGGSTSTTWYRVGATYYAHTGTRSLAYLELQ